MDKNNYCIIMAGGVGSRFWPMSRVSKPKQFLDVLGVGETMIQMTYRRIRRICPPDNIYIVTSVAYKELVKQQLEGIKDDRIITEPARRNTAPCICYANFKILSQNADANIIVAASDHLIADEDEFVKTIEKAMAVTRCNDVLVTLGIKPSYPNTGYGYIQYNKQDSIPKDKDIKKVKLFTEKPNITMAKKFIDSGDFLWNSGIFVWSLQSINKAMEKYLPEVYHMFLEGKDNYNTDKESAFINEVYTSCPAISIDYGVMEKSGNVYVIPSDFGWSDVGTWKALYNVSKKDKDGNSIVGKNVMSYDTKNCIVNVPKDKLVILQGLEGYIVTESDGILMVCKKEEEQRVKQFLTDVEVSKGKEYL